MLHRRRQPLSRVEPGATLAANQTELQNDRSTGRTGCGTTTLDVVAVATIKFPHEQHLMCN